MPRVVHMSMSNTTSDDQIKEVVDEDIEQQVDENSNQRPSIPSIPVYIPPTAFSTNYSQNSVMASHDEDDPYSLRCVIDGKVKKFKKDTREWLHKSTVKAKQKLKQALKLEKENQENQYKIDNCKVETIGKDGIDAIIYKNRAQCSEIEDRIPTERYAGYRCHTLSNDEDSELSCVGDSDADLTYSEATTPTRSFSYVENWRQNGNRSIRQETLSDATSASGHDIYTPIKHGHITENERGNAVRQDLSGKFQHNSSCLENLDITNESGNNIRCAPTCLDISRKIAPAIDIENESVKESMLDCAVKHFAKGLSDEQRVYFTRSSRRKKCLGRLTTSCSPRISKVASQKSFKNHKVDQREGGYNLRSTRANQSTWNDDIVKQVSLTTTNRVNATRNSSLTPNSKNNKSRGQEDAASSSECAICPAVDSWTSGPNTTVRPGTSTFTVPTLFTTAGFALYRNMNVK